MTLPLQPQSLHIEFLEYLEANKTVTAMQIKFCDSGTSALVIEFSQDDILMAFWNLKTYLDQSTITKL